MVEQIELRGVRAFGRHGVLDSERRSGQEFGVDLVLRVDTAVAAASDDVAATVNYASVAADVVSIVGGPAVNLIETLAALIADRVLGSYPAVQSLVVTVHKPHAPVGVPFDDIVIQLERRRDVAVTIGLGANLGSPTHTLRAALGGLSAIPGVWGWRASGLYRTAPVGGPEQPDYVNAVATARTALAPRAILALLHTMEQAFGRTRDAHWGPRTLDLDLIQYGQVGAEGEVVLGGEDLQLPHPRAHERAFVLVPWLEVDPAAQLTRGGEPVSVASLAAALDTSTVRRLDDSDG